MLRTTILSLALLAAPLAQGAQSVPFDEETLDEIEVLNRAINEHYEELQSSASEIESRRAVIGDRLTQIEEELQQIERERAELEPNLRKPGSKAMLTIEEHRVEVKSRYLEALAEKHAVDLEATQAFEIHASGILTNLERLAQALEDSGRLDEEYVDDKDTQKAFNSLQQGTAIALSVLEEWGALGREDPRFRALWATSRVLNRNVQRVQASQGIKATIDLVRERTFVVRSLIDQARVLRAALDHQGLLLQVAAQNQMLRLHFTRLGAINGLELPDLDLDDSTRRILEDIEEEPFDATADAGDPLGGFDDCLRNGVCD